jgi:hypothetical protein
MVALPEKAVADIRPYLCAGTVLMEIADHGEFRVVFSVILTVRGPCLPAYCIVREVGGVWSIVNRLDHKMIEAMAALPDPASIEGWDAAGVAPVDNFESVVRDRANTLLGAAAALRARIGGLIK